MKTRILTFAMLLLSLAVFNWGLQYKMSLYQHSGDKTNAPAKLWTGSKDNSQVQPQAPLVTGTFQVVILIFSLLIVRCQRSLTAFFYARRVSRPWTRRLEPLLFQFSLLPPPAHL